MPTFATQEATPGNDLSVFKNIYDVSQVELTLPKPLQIILPNSQDFGVAVIETETQKAQPIEIIKKTNISYPKASVVTTSAIRGKAVYFVDKDPDTVAEFDVDADGGKASIELSFSEKLTSSALSLELDDHVAPPYMTSVEAEVEGEWITVLASKATYDTYIAFPKRTAKNWRINFSHSQPLRLREITLQDDKLSLEKAGTEVLWLAKPGETYQVYADAVIYKPIKAGELGDLLENPDDIVKGSIGEKQENPAFKEPDSDGDGIPNYHDNCVNLSNPKQEDLDENKRGDACEDHDKDGVMDAVDNCPQDPNYNQQDVDGDKIGDVCDAEESRPTEKMPWLPWVGMGGAAIVVIGIILATLRKK
jgi:hypothetical protein